MREEHVRLEERASMIRRAVLSDKKFMAGVRRSLQDMRDGKSRPWSEVKQELGIEDSL